MLHSGWLAVVHLSEGVGNSIALTRPVEIGNQFLRGLDIFGSGADGNGALGLCAIDAAVGSMLRRSV